MGARAILHVDMDAFYAAVEQRDRPELRGRPVIVGADPKGGRGRGVVSTASYEARRFGVGSAMPVSRAFKLCPQGVYLPVDMRKYAAVSKQVMGVFRRYTDVVEPLSIDEAFLDVTGSARAFGSGPEIAARIKQDIRGQTALTASVGVAACKLVAKIASDMRKPDGLVVAPAGEEAAFLAPLPVRRLWGVGPKLEEQLARLGVQTIGDLARLDPGRLERRLGSHGLDLLALARGEDDRPVIAEGRDAKSIGQEHTYDSDTADRERLRRTLLDLADGVARRLRKADLKARTLTLKYRDESFRTVTRASTLPAPTDEGAAIFAVAARLFEGVHGRLRVRLLGVSASGLEEPPQLDLFPKPPSAADHLRDLVSGRFGPDALTRASLLGRRERRHPEAEDD
ncbi:MAG: DNA polymerase IV [Vicinamibacteria bacterium]